MSHMGCTWYTGGERGSAQIGHERMSRSKSHVGLPAFEVETGVSRTRLPFTAGGFGFCRSHS